MNKIFRIIWNHAQQNWVVTSELASRQGKSNSLVDSSIQPTKSSKNFFLNLISLSVLMSLPLAANAYVAIGGTAQYSGIAQENAGSSIVNGTSREQQAFAGNKIGDRALNYYNPGSKSYDDPDSEGSSKNYSGALSGATGIAIGAMADARATGQSTYKEGESSGIAIGDYSKAIGALSFALGGYSIASDTGATAIGTASRASGFNSLAMMRQSAATNDYAMAIGNVSWAAGKGSLAMGQSSQAAGDRAIAIGSANVGDSETTGPRVTNYDANTNTQALGDRSIAFGAKARTAQTADDAVALGSEANALSRADMAMGLGAVANGTTTTNNTAAMTNANVYAERASAAVAVGAGANATGRNAVAIGAGAEASTAGLPASLASQNRADNVAVGAAAQAAYNAVASGFKSKATGTGSVAIGSGAEAKAQNMIAIGINAGKGGATDESKKNTHGIAIGNGAGQNVISGTENVAIGRWAGMNVEGNTNYAIGVSAGNNVKGADNFAAIINAGQNVEGSQNIALGYYSGQYIKGSSNIAIGKNAGKYTEAEKLTSNNNIAIGTDTKANPGANGNAATAIGANANALANAATALGVSAQALGVASVAIGEAALASAGAPITEGSPITTGATTAVGRQSQATAGSASAFGSNANASGEGATALGNASSASGKYAVASGVQSNASGIQSTAIGRAAQATANDTIAIGSSAKGSAENAIALGINAQALASNAISIGNGNVVTGKNSGAIGDPTTITGAGTYSLGNDNGTIASSDSGVFGNNNNLDAAGDNNRVIGNYNTLQNKASGDMVMGARNTISGATDSEIIGNSNTVQGKQVGVFGDSNTLTENATQSRVLGNNNYVNGSTAMVLANNANVNKASGAKSTGSIAIGNNVTTEFDNSTAIGTNASAVNSASTAIGVSAQASSINALAIGSSSNAQATQSVAVGTSAHAYSSNSLALGTSSSANGASAIAIGNSAATAKQNSMAVGVQANANGNGAAAFGKQANATGDNTVAVGTSAIASTGGSTALGPLANAFGDVSLAVGNSSKAEGGNSMAVGQNSQAVGASSMAVGQEAVAKGNNALALGYQAKAEKGDSLAMGYGAQATLAGSVALGAGSVTGSAVKTSSATVNGITYSGFAGDKIGSSRVVSVGTTTGENQQRQIQNVAAGRITATSTDAINGSQLYMVANTLGNVATTTKNILGGDATLDPATGNITMTNIGGTGKNTVDEAIKAAKTEVKAGTNVANVATSTDTTDGHTIYTVNANGTTVSKGSDLVKVTPGTKDTNNVTDYAVDLSDGAKASLDKADTALQSWKAQIVNGDDTTEIKTVNQSDSTFSFEAGDNITLENDNSKLKISAPANGSVTDGNTGLVNGGTVYNAIEGAKTRYYSVNDGGNQGANYNNDGATGLNALAAGVGAQATGENVVTIGHSAGSNDSTANNSVYIGEQAGMGSTTNSDRPENVYIGSGAGKNTVGGWNTSIGTQNAGAGITGDLNVALGQATLYKVVGNENTGLGVYAGQNSTGNNNTSVGAQAGRYVEGSNNTSVGYNAGANSVGSNNVALGNEAGQNVTMSDTVSIGNGAKANAQNGDVALGSGSTTATVVTTDSADINGLSYGGFAGNDPKSTVSVGSAGAERTITNVAAGRISKTSTDAINGSQLYAVADTLGNVANTVVNNLGGNAAVDEDGNITMTDIGGTGKDTVDDAIKATKTEVVAGKQVTVTSEKDAQDGHTKYTVNATKTTVAGSGDVVISGDGTADSEGVIAYTADLSQTTKDNIQKGVDAKDTIDTLGVNFGGDTGKVFARKLGEQANVKGGASGELTEGNIGVVSNGTDTLTVKLAKDIDLTKEGTLTIGDTVLTNDTIATDSVIANNVNVGGTTISEGKVEGLDDRNADDDADYGVGDNATRAATEGAVKNVDDKFNNATFGLKAEDNNTVTNNLNNTVDVVGADSNITTKVEDNKLKIELAKNLDLGKDGSVTMGDTKVDGNGLTINNGPSITKDGGIDAGNKPITNVASGGNVETNAANIGDVNKAGWNIQGNGTANGKVVNDNTVNFVNGTGTTATVTGSNGSYSVKYDVNKTTFKTDDSGNVSAVDTGDNFATAKDVADAINNAQKTVEVAAGTNIASVESETEGKKTTFTVNAKGTTVSVSDELALTTDSETNKANNITDYKVALSDKTKEDIKKGVDAKDAVDTKGVGFAGDSGNGFSRKLGEQTNVKGGVTDETKLTDNNIGVVSDGKDTLTVKLAKDLKDLNSISANTVTAGDTTMTTDGITISNGTKGNPVSLTKDGLDNGGNQITNVASGGDVDSNAANIGDIKSAVNKGGWNIQGNGTANGKVVNDNTVNFVNGTGTTATVTGSDGSYSVKYDVNKTTFNTDDSGNVSAVENGDNFATAKDVADAINNAQKTVEVAAGTNIASVESKTEGKKTTFTVNAKGTTVSVSDDLALTTDSETNKANNITDYKVALSDKTKEDIKKGVDAKDAVDTKGVGFAGDSGNGFSRKLGEQTNVKGGVTDETKLTDNNIGVVSDGKDTLTVKLAKDVNLGENGSLTVGNTNVNNEGVATPKVTTGSTVMEDGKITGLTARDPSASDYGVGDNATRAATEGAVKNVDDKFNNATFGLKAEDDKTVTNKLNNTVDVVGADSNITTKVEENKLKIELAKTLDLGKDGSVTMGDTKVDGNGLTINDGPSITKDGGIDAGNKPITNVASGGDVDSNAANIGDIKSAVNKGGWNIQGNGTANGKVVNDNTVNFVNGTGTTATVTGSDGSYSVKYDVNKTTFNTDDSGNVSAVENGDNFATAKDVADAINNAQKTVEVAAGTNIASVESKTEGKKTTFTVNAKGTTVSVSDDLALTTDSETNKANNITDYKVALSDKTKEDIKKGVDAKDAVDTKGVGFAGDSGNGFSRKLGEQTNVKGGVTDETKLTDNNIGVVSDGKDTLTVKLAKDVNLGENGSLTVGNTNVNNEGVATPKVTTGSTVMEDGKITGLTARDPSASDYGVGDNATRAATEGAVKNVDDKFNNATFGLKAEDDKTVTNKLNNTVDVVGADSNITTKVEENKLKIELAKTLDLGKDGSVTMGDTKVDGNGLTINDGPSITKDGGIDAGNKPITNVASGGDVDSNAANIGDIKSAVNKGGWNIQGNGTANGKVVNNNTVNFVNGTGTTATVTGSNGSYSVKYDVNKTTFKTDDSGNVSAVDTGDNFATAKDVADAINNAQKTVEVAAGTNIASVESETEGKKTTFTVNAKGTTVSVSDELALTTDSETNKANNITDYKVALSDKTKKDIQKGVDAKDAVDTKGVGFAGDSGDAFSRKLGEQTNVKGGVTDETKLTDNNIGVVSDGKDTLTVKLAKDVNLGENGSLTVGNTNVNNEGVATPKVTTGSTVMEDGKITGLTARDPSASDYGVGDNATRAATEGAVKNVDDKFNNATFGLKAEDDKTVTKNLNNTVDVVGADNNITTKVEENKLKIELAKTLDLGKNGSVTMGDTKVDGNGLTINNGPSITKDGGIDAGNKPITNVASGGDVDSNAANIGDIKSAVNKGGWNIQGNGTANGKVVNNNTVNFVNGTGTTATVTGSNGSYSVKYDVNKTTFNTDDSGNVSAVNTGDNFATAKDVADAINNAQKTVEVAAGTNIASVDSETEGKKTTFTVNAKGTTVTEGDGLTVTPTDAGNNVTDYSVALSDKTKEDIKKGVDAKDAVDTKGVGFAGDSGDAFSRKLGEQTNVKGGVTDETKLTDNNIGVVSDGKDTLTVKLAKDLKDLNSVSANTVTAGDTMMNTDGITINNGKAGKPVSLTKDGLDNGGNQIKNVASGGDVDSNAANIGDLKNATSNLVNTGFNIAADNGNKDNVKLGETVKFTDPNGNIVTTVADNEIKLALNKDLTVGDDKEPGTITVKGENGKDGVSLNGKDGSIGLNGKDGANGTITVKQGKPGVDGKDGGQKPRLDINGEDVATLNDGLKFQGNNDTTAAIQKKLNETLTIKGENAGDDVSATNMYVENSGSELIIKMAKALTDLTSATFTTPDGNTTVVNNNGVTITPKDGQKKPVSLTDAGLDNGGNQITNVASGGTVETNAANIGDLKNATSNLVNTGFNIAADNGNKDNVKLGETVKFTDPNGNIVTTVADNEIKLALNKDLTVGDDKEPGTITVKGENGKDGVSLNGKDGSIGLNGKDGASGTITVKQGKPGVDGKDGEQKPRLDINGEDVATLNDGLKFAGDKGDTLIKKLNETVTIKGKAQADADVTDKNLRVDSENGELVIKMAKALTDLTSVATGDTLMDNNGVTINNGKAGKPVSLTKDGLDNGGNKITNVAAGTAPTDAVNVSQLEKAQKAATTKVVEGKNIKVTETKNTDGSKTYTVATADDLDVNSVKAGDTVLNKQGVKVGDTVLNKDGVKVGDKVALTKDGLKVGDVNISTDGINAGNKKVTGVANGDISATSQDAVNGSQLYTVQQAAKAAKTEVEAGDNIEVTSKTGGNGQTVYTVATKKEVNFDQVNVGGVSINKDTGINAGNNKVTGVSAGNINANSTDAVNGSQLHETNQNVAENAANIANNTATINKGLNFTADDGQTLNRKLGDTVAVNGDENIKTSVTSSGVKVALNKNLKVDSITAGNTVVNNEGVTIGSGNNAVSLTQNGLNNGGNRITNVAPGTAPTDAVNVAQLSNVANHLDNKVNKVAGDMKRMDKKLRAGIAGAAALGMLPQPTRPGKSMVSVGGTTYRNESAVALGVSRVSDNEKWVIKVGASANTRNNYIVGGSVGYQW
ncbi:YadA-like family protein [Avibacterium sp. 20-129]|uniref:YadA-like family protein n=1 Tax=Avibacterium sp. 20-129 TaxID=2911525 RepID=UPI0022461612|nr:YadA-like family protein [Avibacterium sp. 20-129]MCW9699670.1 YadA-like family protein [Avibacterium sp. 20-129]